MNQSNYQIINLPIIIISLNIIMSLNITELQTTLTTIANAKDLSINSMIDLTYNALFSVFNLDANIKTDIDELLTIMDSFGDNNGQLTSNDFVVFSQTAKKNPLMIASFISAVSAKGIALYNNAKRAGTSGKITKASLSDFIFRLIIFVVLVPLLKSKEGDVFKDNIDEIFALIDIINTAYKVYVATGEFKETLSLLKNNLSVICELFNCCIQISTNKQSVVNSLVNNNLRIASLAVQQTKLESLINNANIKIAI